MARTPTPVHAPIVELLVMSFFTSAWQAGCKPRYSAAMSDEVVAAAAAERRTLLLMTSTSNRLRKAPRRDLIERGRPRSVVKRGEQASGSVARSHVPEDCQYVCARPSSTKAICPLSHSVRSACTAMMQPVSERPNDGSSNPALGISAQRVRRSKVGLMYLRAELADHLQVHRTSLSGYICRAGTPHGQQRLALQRRSDDAKPDQGNR